jgi:pilus assembly protein CpaE
MPPVKTNAPSAVRRSTPKITIPALGTKPALDDAEPMVEPMVESMLEPMPPVSAEPQSRVPGLVVTVFSPKGGAGKTVVSTNLAVALNAGGAHRVCLVDLDLQFGDVAITVGLAPSRSMIDAVDQDRSLDGDQRVNALITPWQAGLDCVLAPIDPAGADRISVPLVAEVIASLKARYDYVVIDTPPQLSEVVLEALDASDYHVLVTTPEIPSVKNLRLTLDVLDLLAYTSVRREIVLNRFDPKAGLSPEDAAAAIGSAVTAIIPASPEVSASVNVGVSLSLSDPKHPVSVAVREFADREIARTPFVAGQRSSRFGLKLRMRTS